jgi:hypothetical protein
MHEQSPCRKSTLHIPEDTRRVGRPAIGCLDSAGEDLKTTGVRNWRRKSQDQDQDQWRTIVKEAEVYCGLQRLQKKRNQKKVACVYQYHALARAVYEKLAKAENAFGLSAQTR